MGQQHLLLLVFGIVLVGGAVVAGVHALEPGKPANNRTLVFQEALDIVHDIQVWKMKSTSIGGGSGSSGFDMIDFTQLGRRPTLLSNRVYKTEYGCYLLRVEGPDDDARVIITAPSCARRDYVAHVTISGTEPGDVDWLHDRRIP